jgi:hypothetical protein
MRLTLVLVFGLSISSFGFSSPEKRFFWEPDNDKDASIIGISSHVNSGFKQLDLNFLRWGFGKKWYEINYPSVSYTIYHKSGKQYHSPIIGIHLLSGCASLLIDKSKFDAFISLPGLLHPQIRLFPKSPIKPFVSPAFDFPISGFKVYPVFYTDIGALLNLRIIGISGFYRVIKFGKPIDSPTFGASIEIPMLPLGLIMSV